MKVIREDSPPRQVTLTIELDESDVEPYLQRAYRQVVRRVAIPGFRKGKAPRSLVERYVGRGALLREALEDMVTESVNQAVKDESIASYGQPEVDLEEVDPPRIKAVVPLEPSVDLGDYRALRLPLEVPAVEDAQVDEVIERIRKDSAPWEPVERPAEMGDLVVLDVTGTIDGETVLEDSGVEFLLFENNRLPLPGFQDPVLGMSADETKEFDVEVPEDYGNAEVVGKTCRFKVVVHGVKTKALPELDDEFAKGVGDGEHETLDALRAHIRNRLQEEADREARSALRDEALRQVTETATLEIPNLVVERELEHLLQDQEEALKERRVRVEDYLTQLGKSQEELREELRPRALERVKRALILDKITELEGIQVTPEEIQSELAGMTASEGGQQLAAAFNTPNGAMSLANILRTRKVLARLEAIVTDALEAESPAEDTPPADAGEEETPAPKSGEGGAA